MNQLILALATLGPIGKKLPAPGTMGSLVGLFCYTLLVLGFEISAEWVTFFFYSSFFNRYSSLLAGGSPSEP